VRSALAPTCCCAEYADRITALEARVEVLERRAGPGDQADVALLAVLADSTAGRWFTSRELLGHAGIDARLAEALAEACIQSPPEAGCYPAHGRHAR
jgi:hypothetical protein